MGRWRRQLDPSIKHGLWKVPEDAKLTVLYSQYGGQWARICTHVRGRTAQQCRARCSPLKLKPARHMFAIELGGSTACSTR